MNNKENDVPVFLMKPVGVDFLVVPPPLKVGLSPSTRRGGPDATLFHTFASLRLARSPWLRFALLCHTFASLLLAFASLRSLCHLYS